MISKRERNKIKKILGKYYSNAVSEHLYNKGIRNKYGNPHSNSMIRNVMNGQHHEEIETQIFDLVEKTVARKKEVAENRKELLSA